MKLNDFQVRRYSEFITQPMWLDRIKQKLESGEYQMVGEFVSDFQLIFSNCSTFNRVRFTETCYIINTSLNNRSIAC